MCLGAKIRGSSLVKKTCRYFFLSNAMCPKSLASSLSMWAGLMTSPHHTCPLYEPQIPQLFVRGWRHTDTWMVATQAQRKSKVVKETKVCKGRTQRSCSSSWLPLRWHSKWQNIEAFKAMTSLLWGKLNEENLDGQKKNFFRKQKVKQQIFLKVVWLLKFPEYLLVLVLI